jgi:hypothetical protein
MHTTEELFEEIIRLPADLQIKVWEYVEFLKFKSSQALRENIPQVEDAELLDEMKKNRENPDYLNDREVKKFMKRLKDA